ncbi:MAG: hypothetical protein ACREEM_30115 [Blastocatellia bacterium]
MINARITIPLTPSPPFQGFCKVASWGGLVSRNQQVKRSLLNAWGLQKEQKLQKGQKGILLGPFCPFLLFLQPRLLAVAKPLVCQGKPNHHDFAKALAPIFRVLTGGRKNE